MSSTLFFALPREIRDIVYFEYLYLFAKDAAHSWSIEYPSQAINLITSYDQISQATKISSQFKHELIKILLANFRTRFTGPGYGYTVLHDGIPHFFAGPLLPSIGSIQHLDLHIHVWSVQYTTPAPPGTAGPTNSELNPRFDIDLQFLLHHIPTLQSLLVTYTLQIPPDHFYSDNVIAFPSTNRVPYMMRQVYELLETVKWVPRSKIWLSFDASIWSEKDVRYSGKGSYLRRLQRLRSIALVNLIDRGINVSQEAWTYSRTRWVAGSYGAELEEYSD